MELITIKWFGKEISIVVDYCIESCSLSYSNYEPSKVEIDGILVDGLGLNLNTIKPEFKSLIETTILQKDAQCEVSFDGQFQYN